MTLRKATLCIWHIASWISGLLARVRRKFNLCQNETGRQLPAGPKETELLDYQRNTTPAEMRVPFSVVLAKRVMKYSA